MRMPRPLVMTLLILIASAAAALPASAENQVSRYHSVSMGGISSDSYTAGEFAEFSASVEFSRGKALNPALSLRWLMPLNPLSYEGSLAGLGLDITLFYMGRHPLARLSPRKSSLAPLLSLTAYVPVADLANPIFSVGLSPFRLFTGFGYFSAGIFSLVLDDSFAVDGWGLKLFEFSYMVY